jgi:hypothetical protein
LVKVLTDCVPEIIARLQPRSSPIGRMKTPRVYAETPIDIALAMNESPTIFQP